MTDNFRKNFGAGLEAVLGAVGTKFIESEDTGKELKIVMVYELSPGKHQPRRDFDQATLQELADSIASQGILQPIVVRDSGIGEYEIIAGERRWRAAQMAGLQQVPVIICNISDESALAFGLIENIQRENLNVIEESDAYFSLLNEFHLSHEEIALKVGKSRSHITNILRLRDLPTSAKSLVVSGEITMGHARSLLTLPEEKQLSVIQQIIEKGLSVRETERIVSNLKNDQGDRRSVNFLKHERADYWSQSLADKLSKKVDVKVNTDGVGKITLYFDSSEEIDWLIEKIK